MSIWIYSSSKSAKGKEERRNSI